MRKTAVLLSFLFAFFTFAQSPTPDALLERGMTAYRAADYSSAVTDLQAAAQAFLSPDKMQTYVNTGSFEGLDKFETSLVYLALSQSRLGREADARETILRLMSAERIKPTYARLQLAEAAEFDQLVATLTPGTTLPRNVQIAGGTATTTTTTTATTEDTAALPSVTPTAPAATVAAADDQSRVAITRTLAEERAERQRIIDEIVARERERIQGEADVRIASERQAAERAASERVAIAEREAQQKISAAEVEANQRIAATEAQTKERLAQIESETSQRMAAIQNEAQQKIDAANREAEQRIASFEKQAQERLVQAEAEAASRIAAAQRDAETRVAEAQAAARRDAETRIAEAQATAQRDADARIAAIQRETETRIASERAAAAAQVAEAAAVTHRAYMTSLRQANAFANSGQLEDANSLYLRVANSENVPREALGQAAIGLYRTGAFKSAVDAFRRLGTFNKGEEDLRYYHAVALFETGHYKDAQKELACALPFIQVTDDVTRYRVKIEQTAAQQAMR